MLKLETLNPKTCDNKDCRRCKIFVFLACKVSSSSTLCGKYQDKALIAPLAFFC